VRADDDARHEEPDDLREPQPPAEPENGERSREDDDEVPEEGPLEHVRSIGRALSESVSIR
jgi:hypothetical protein